MEEKVNSILGEIKMAKLFENCSGLFSYLAKDAWSKVEDIIKVVADTEKESKEPAVVRSSITAFVFGFFLGHCAYKITKELLEKGADGKGTEEELLFAFHFAQLQKKFQSAGILSRSRDSRMS